MVKQKKNHGSVEEYVPQRGDIVFVEFPEENAAFQGDHPAVVVQNNVANRHSPNVIVVPLTSRLKKQDQPTHKVLDPGGNGLSKPSMTLCENIQCVPKTAIRRFVGRCTPEDMEHVDRGIAVATGLPVS